MNFILTALSAVLALMLLTAGVAKLLRLEDFAAALKLSDLPDAVIRPLVLAVPFLEIALSLAIALTRGTALIVSLALVTALMVSFTAWIVWVLSRGVRLRCSCFGAYGAEVTIRTLLRNACMVTAATAAVILATRTQPVTPETSFQALIAVSAAEAAVAVAVAVLSARRSLVLTMAQALDRTEEGGIA